MSQTRPNRRGRVEKVRLHKINEEIISDQVRVVYDGKNEIMSSTKALSLAREEGVDLVQIAEPSDGVPVCKIIQYNKFEYENKLKQKEIKQKAKQSILKTIGISAHIGEHDMETKAKQANKFLIDNNKVRVELTFKGRENMYRDQGQLALLRFAQLVEENGKVEQLPMMDNKKMFMMIVPRKK